MIFGGSHIRSAIQLEITHEGGMILGYYGKYAKWVFGVKSQKRGNWRLRNRWWNLNKDGKTDESRLTPAAPAEVTEIAILLRALINSLERDAEAFAALHPNTEQMVIQSVQNIDGKIVVTYQPIDHD